MAIFFWDCVMHQRIFTGTPWYQVQTHLTDQNWGNKSSMCVCVFAENVEIWKG